MCTLTPLAPTPVGAAASMSSLEPEPPTIDWGAPSSTQQPTIRAPSLPNLASQNSPAFPVTFEEESSAVADNGPLHQLPPAPARLQQNAPAAQSQVASSGRDPFIVMWEQIKNVPLSNITQRWVQPCGAH
ncbi:hypothetical protein TELCIR_02895 [Teladorsagia circumcincta]|uniref:Uncharacterized protein n=1 Tax=Teladorsagia circumcincta TaxID=45464 RepID=A0A2G9UY06_TELCI|nr:hypothetical protein TELCIR_02895 [Teladorsagia circumcincta]